MHYLDEGIDTGDLIVQKEVAFGDGETLATSYAILQAELQQLFFDHWPRIRVGECERNPKKAGGSFHRLKDKERISHLLTNGWDTPVSSIRAVARWEDSAKSVFRD